MLKRTHKLQCRQAIRSFSSNIPKADSCLYKTLAIKPDANQQEVREAFLQKAREFHPDKRPDCLEYFTHVTKAYEILSDAQKRAIYDDEQITDEDYFSVKVAGIKINMIAVMMTTALAGVGYYGFNKMQAKSKEGACPVGHKERQEMVATGRK